MTYRLSALSIFAAFALLNGFIFGVAHLSAGGSLGESFGLGGIIMLQIVGMAAILFLASSVGVRLLRMLKAGIVPESLRFAYAIGLGLGVFSLSTFMFALTQNARLFPMLCLLAVLAVFSRSEHIALWRELTGKQLCIPAFLDQKRLWIGLGFGLVLIELSFISSAANILSADFDSFHQYLTFPMEYFKQGGLTIFEWHPSWGFPQFGEMLSLLSIILLGITGPFFLNFGLMLLLVAFVFQALRHFGATMAVQYIFSACILVSPTIFAIGSGILKIELVYYFYCVLMLVLAREILTVEPTRAFASVRIKVILGVILGVLLSIKYTAFFIIAAFWLSLWLVSEKKWQLLHQAVAIMGIASILFLPWLIKNWVVYESPLYPLFVGKDQFFLDTGESLIAGFRNGARHDMILQFSSVIHATGHVIFDNLQIFFFSIANLSPVGLFPGVWTVIMCTLSLLIVSRFRLLDRYSKFLIFFSLFFGLGWCGFLIGAMWYLYPVWFALLFLVALNPLSGRAGTWMLNLTLVVVAISGLMLIVSNIRKTELSLRYANGDITFREAAIREWGSTASFDAYDRVNTLLAQDSTAKVYSFQDPRGYFINHSSNRFILDYYGEKLFTLGSPTEIRTTLRSLGVRYILGSRLREADCQRSKKIENPICTALHRFQLFVETESLPILFTEDDVTLYRL